MAAPLPMPKTWQNLPSPGTRPCGSFENGHMAIGTPSFIGNFTELKKKRIKMIWYAWNDRNQMTFNEWMEARHEIQSNEMEWNGMEWNEIK